MARTRQPKSIDAFTNPFLCNHCVVLAYTTIAGTWTPGAAIELANRASNKGLLTREGSANRWQRADGSVPRFWEKDVAEHDHELTAHRWAELIGYRVVEVIHFPRTYRWDARRGRRVSLRPQVRQFCRHQGKTGHWVVSTRHHARAVIDGQAYFYARPGARVETAIRLEKKEGK